MHRLRVLRRMEQSNEQRTAGQSWTSPQAHDLLELQLLLTTKVRQLQQAQRLVVMQCQFAAGSWCWRC